MGVLRAGDDRSVSPVIGTILLIGIMVVLMSVIAVFVLGGGPVQGSPDAEFVIEQEPGEYSAIVVVTSTGGLSGEHVEVRVNGNEARYGFTGDEPLERGDHRLVLEKEQAGQWTDLEEGDVVQIVYVGPGGQESILETYTIGSPPAEPAPADFAVDVTTNSPVNAGEDVEVLVTVDNVGDQVGSQTIDVSILDEDNNDVKSDSFPVGNLGPTDTPVQVALTWESNFTDEGVYTVVATSENRSDDETIHVEEPDEGNVDLLEDWTVSPSVSDPDETITVYGTVENTGGQVVDDWPIEFYVAPEPGDSPAYEETERTGELAPGDTEEVTFQTTRNDEGTYDVWVFEFDEAEAEVGDDWHGDFEIEDDSGEPEWDFQNWNVEPDEVYSNDEVTVTGEVHNVGDGAGDPLVEFYTSDNPGDPVWSAYEGNEQVGELEPGDDATVTFTVSREAAGEYAVRTGIWDAEAGSWDVQFDGDFEVLEEPTEPEFVLNGWTIDHTEVEEGGEVTIEGEVENVGGATGVDDVDLWINGNWVGMEQNLELDTDESAWVTFTVDESDYHRGLNEVTVNFWEHFDDEWETEFEVLYAEFTVDIEGIYWISSDNSIEVDVTVENVGTMSDFRFIDLHVSRSWYTYGWVDYEGVTIDPNDSQQVTLEWSWQGSCEMHTVTVDSYNPDDNSSDDDDSGSFYPPVC